MGFPTDGGGPFARVGVETTLPPSSPSCWCAPPRCSAVRHLTGAEPHAPVPPGLSSRREHPGPFAEVTAHAAETAETNPAVSAGARLGFLLDGVLHVAMGWAGLRIA